MLQLQFLIYFLRDFKFRLDFAKLHGNVSAGAHLFQCSVSAG